MLLKTSPPVLWDTSHYKVPKSCCNSFYSSLFISIAGYAKRGVPPGTPFDQIEKFRCPECGAKKKYFVSETETVSGFKENLKYGIGTNNLTGGQKANLIYGGLFVGFLIFMSGYLLE